MTEHELISTVIEEITEYKLERYKANDTAYAALLKEISELSQCVQSIREKLSDEDAGILNRYISKTLFLADKDCKYLYEQGAKDCVGALKHLGIL